jgi:hypothetical protein
MNNTTSMSKRTRLPADTSFAAFPEKFGPKGLDAAFFPKNSSLRDALGPPELSVEAFLRQDCRPELSNLLLPPSDHACPIDDRS